VPRVTDETWKATALGRANRVGTYTHRRAVENAARKHGQALGPQFRAMLAARLVLVDVAADETVIAPESAARLVETWAAEGPRAKGDPCRG